MAWIEIDTGVYALETKNPTQIIVLADVKAERDSYQSLLDAIAEDIVHEDKEYEAWKNEQLDRQRQIYTERTREVQEILDQING